jgi:hypothetical protein
MKKYKGSPCYQSDEGSSSEEQSNNLYGVSSTVDGRTKRKKVGILGGSQ